MCEGCWNDYGRPAEWNASIDRARGLILAIQSECSTCAPLHALVENWNVGTEPGDHVCDIYEPLDDFEPHVMEAARELSGLLAAMTVAERASTLAYVDGYAETPPDASRDWQDLVAAWLLLPPREPRELRLMPYKESP